MPIRYDNFINLLENQNPENIAIQYYLNNIIKEISYLELIKMIRDYSLPNADVIGVFLANNIASIVAFFALAGHKQIVVLDENENIDSLIKKIKHAHVNYLIGEDEELIEELDKYLEKDFHTDDKDILFFTSGTTSEAKAVVLTEQSLCSATFNGGSLLPLEEKDNLLSVLPLNHVFGLVCSIFWPLSFGARVSLGNGLRQIFTDFSLYKPTVTTLVPEMAKFLVFNNLFNNEIRLILIGAGSCDDLTLNKIKSLGIRLSYGYGLTETSSGIALSLKDNPRSMSICPDYKIEIANDNEIIVYSDHTLMKGYYEDEESTKKVLDGNKFYTGDLGKIEDGYLYITGRKKEILVFADGSKLYIPEYEQKLIAFLNCKCDLAIMQNAKGQVVLYIYEPKDIDDKIQEFNRNQSRSHQIEKIIYAKEKLPRTETGKVKRYLLKIGD